MKFGRVVMVLLFFVLFCAPSISSADEPSDAPLGRYVGGSVGGLVQGNANGEVIIGNWWENFGVEAGVSYFKTKRVLERKNADDLTLGDSYTVRVGIVGKAGQSIGRMKPYLGLGFRYESTKLNAETLNRIKRDLAYIVPSLGVDIRVSEHLMLGVVLVSTPLIVDGDQNIKGGDTFDGDIDGSNINVLSSFSVAYLF